MKATPHYNFGWRVIPVNIPDCVPPDERGIYVRESLECACERARQGSSFNNMEYRIDYTPVNTRDANGGMILLPMDHIIQDRAIASWIKHNHYQNDIGDYQANHHKFAETHQDVAQIYFSKDSDGTGHWPHIAFQHGCGNVDFIDE